MPIDAPESTDKNNSKEEQYSIVRDRSRRDIRPLQRYVDLIAYTLSVTKKKPMELVNLLHIQTLFIVIILLSGWLRWMKKINFSTEMKFGF